MTCTAFIAADGARAFVCGPRPRKRRCACGALAELLCDWKVGKGTCDKPICAACTVSPTPDKDLCPEHAAAWEAWQARRAK